MATWEVSFRIKYDYPLIEVSERYPGTKISMWCVWDREMIHLPHGEEALLVRIEEDIRESGMAIGEFQRSADGSVTTLKCTCGIFKSIWDYTSESHGIDVNPAVFLDGWGYFRTISFSEEDLRKYFSDLGKLGQLELISKKNLHQGAVPSTVWTESFFTGLTEKQMEALCKAYDYGYYSSPRGITTESIATSLGVSRSTYEEHLRKAENRIIESIIPYLKLFKAGTRKKEEMLSPGIMIESS